ncbi:hypothetical protein BGZ82_011774 [Podila clonocystis]|nr:hypothetical protein BGZ82_011774 [Podila clonocystis]
MFTRTLTLGAAAAALALGVLSPAEACQSGTIRITRNQDYCKGLRCRSSVQLHDGTWLETSWKHYSNSMWDCSNGNYCYAPMNNNGNGHLQTKFHWKKGAVKTYSEEQRKDGESIYEYWDCL